MNIKKAFSAIFNTKKRVIAFFASLAIVILGITLLAIYNYTPEADTTFMNKLLLEASDLTTAKLKITNMTEYEDTGIKLLNKSNFIMVYEATVDAGIDMKKVEIFADDLMKVIRVKIPKAEILGAKVDSSTIKYFDEKFSLFNMNEKEDVNNAVVLAEKSAEEEARNTGILEFADNQAATIIEGLLSHSIPKGYKLEVKGVE